MLDFPRWKVWSVSLLCLIGIAFAIPSFVPEAQVAKWPSFLPSTQVNLGLDLAGGSQLLLEADTSDVAKQRLDTMEETIRVGMRRASPRIEIGEISTSGGRLSFMVRNPAQVDAAVEFARAQTLPVGMGPRDWDVTVMDQNRVVMTPTAAGIEAALDSAMQTAREVVYNRVDPEGTKEVTVVRQGARRILVQVPGLEDPEGLKTLLGKTARLEFKLVDLTADPTRCRPAARPPEARCCRWRKAAAGSRCFAARWLPRPLDQCPAGVRRDHQRACRKHHLRQRWRAILRAGDARECRQAFRDRARQCGLSAPNINEPILGGQAQISGSFTLNRQPALCRPRSGKLPVKLTVVEERTVGPDLGADSIRLGVIAGTAHSRGADLHDPDLRPIRGLCEHRAHPQRRHHPRRHGDLQLEPHSAGIAASCSPSAPLSTPT
jgi:preprotein translocase subunit SecD